MIIRPHSSDDYQGIVTCMIELQDYERTLEPNFRHPGPDIADEYLRSLLDACQKKKGKIFVAEDRGIVGFVCVWIEREEGICEANMDMYAYVSDIVVMPEKRGQGIGTALLRTAESLAKERGLKILKLGALARNMPAMDLYHRYGFRDYEVTMVKEVE